MAAVVLLSIGAGVVAGHAAMWRQTVEKRINELLDQSLVLITALDMMEVDPDFEPDGDDEHSLGWTERGPSAFGESTDRERDDSDDEEGCEDEGAQCDDEGVIDSGYADADALHAVY